MKMRIDFISLFPEFLEAFTAHSMIKRAQESQILELHCTNPRSFSGNKHDHIDDTPYGGGSGMLMRAEPIFLAVESILPQRSEKDRVILTAPTGRPFTQEKAKELAQYERLILICGHYEGIDQRVEDVLVDETISIGDYVLTGGELPAMVIADAVARMLPGVLGNPEGISADSFYTPLLEYPQYTRPAEFRGYRVPDILLSGHHANIEKWRHEESIRRTQTRRPDIWKKYIDSLAKAEEE